MATPLGPRFWDFYSTVYDAFSVRQGYQASLARALSVAKGLRFDRRRYEVLDACTGTGNAALALAREGFKVLGVDFSPGMLALARAKALAQGLPAVRFRQVDDLSAFLQSDRDRPLVFWLLGLHLMADPAEALGLMARALAPGGTLVLTVPTGRMRILKALRDLLPAYGAAKGALFTAAAWAVRVAGRASSRMRTFTRPQVEELLRGAGFRIRTLEAIPEGPLFVVARREPPRLRRRGRRSRR